MSQIHCYETEYSQSAGSPVHSRAELAHRLAPQIKDRFAADQTNT